LALLHVERISKMYGKRMVVQDVSFEVGKGEIVGLLGPNGAGKTTSFKITVGMIKSHSGRVFFNGADATNLQMYKRARLGMGYLPQESSVFRKLTVEENILAILETLHLSRKVRMNRMRMLLDELELTRLAKNYAGTLSGGERRRLEITRALVTNPDLILLDEPFSGVDPMAVFDIQSIIKKLKRRGIGILLTDHSVREILAVTDRAYIINEGVVLRHGKPEELVSDEVVRKIYLGEQFQATGIGRIVGEETAALEPITIHSNEPDSLPSDAVFGEENGEPVSEETFKLDGVDGADRDVSEIESQIERQGESN